MLIEWSEEDRAYLVTLPEFVHVIQPVTHGSTYVEAARKGQEVLELLVESSTRDGETLPEPVVFSLAHHQHYSARLDRNGPAPSSSS